MKISFTGPQTGMNKLQSELLFKELLKIEIEEAHHGGCDGCDDQFDEILYAVKLVKKSEFKIYIHPSIYQKDKVFHSGIILEVKEPLVRNHDIVDRGHNCLFTTPKGEEVRRSGTWATIRYAKKQYRRICMIHPDGTIEYLNFRKPPSF